MSPGDGHASAGGAIECRAATDTLEISIGDLVAGLPGADTVHQALPVHVPARAAAAAAASGVDAATMTSTEVEDSVSEIIRECLHAHGGEFNPSKISHKALGLEWQDERMWSRLNKLLLPTQLRPFVENSVEFSWQEKGRKGMMITWSTTALASQPAPSSASV